MRHNTLYARGRNRLPRPRLTREIGRHNRNVSRVVADVEMPAIAYDTAPATEPSSSIDPIRRGRVKIKNDSIPSSGNTVLYYVGTTQRIGPGTLGVLPGRLYTNTDSRLRRLSGNRPQTRADNFRRVLSSGHRVI